MLTPNIRLERPLARGGMGSVWLADHLGLHTKVVVKFIAEEVAGHPEVIARFEREAAAASQVKSQHVVQMLDHGISPVGLAYIAMELLEGYSLADHLDAHPFVPPPQVAHVIAQAAKALGRAHEKGVVHRDIKPDNIFLCDGGDGEAFVKVLDFGIAKFTGAGNMETTKTGAMLGTLYYMSPEQVMGAKSLDHRADLWALTIVAYEMLTGRRPFEGETMGAISVRICSTEFAPASSHNPSLTPAIDAFFEQALARDINVRFTSAKALAEGFDQAVGGARALPLSASVRAKPSPTIELPPSSMAMGPRGTLAATVATPPPTYTPQPATPPGSRQAAMATSVTSASPGRGRAIALTIVGALGLGAAVGVALYVARSGSSSAEAQPAQSKAAKVAGTDGTSDEVKPPKKPAAETEDSPSASGKPSASAPPSTSSSKPTAASAQPSSASTRPSTLAAPTSTPSATAAAPKTTAPTSPTQKPKAKTDDPDMF
jgi:serine/threonine-protein kinase